MNFKYVKYNLNSRYVDLVLPFIWHLTYFLQVDDLLFIIPLARVKY